ncbi:MAG: hypothetical protein SNG59_05010 [Rikenellaceae bacterium]
MERGKINLTIRHDGRATITIEFADGALWVTPREIARLLGVTLQRVNANLRSLFKSQELTEHTSELYHNGVFYYNLDVIIALAFKINGGYCRLFRGWITSQVTQSFSNVDNRPIIIQLGKTTFINN